MKRFRLSRRAVLAGLGGAAIRLPLLECMFPSEAHAQQVSAPRRFVLMWGGVSTGRHNTDLLRPGTFGENYPINTALEPLQLRGVRAHTGIVSNLVLPFSGPAARTTKWHTSTPSVLLTGTRGALSPTGEDWQPLRSATVDQLVVQGMVAPLPTAQRPRIDSLVWQVQPTAYRSSEAAGRISMRRNPDGSHAIVAPVASPQVIFRTLFGAAAGGTSDAQRREALRQQSVLDLVRRRTEVLMRQVGSSDRTRLERHFDEIRDLERNVAALLAQTTVCRAPADPGTDPGTTTTSDDRGATIGYSDEAKRAKLLVEMLYLALACDLSRVASVLLSFSPSFMNAGPLLGAKWPASLRLDLHEVGHTQALDQPRRLQLQSYVVQWHVDVFADLVQRLAAAPDGTGTLLDRTAVVLAFEGGTGFDPETGDTGGTHSSENMNVLYAGCPDRLRPNLHTNGNRAHPSQVLLSAMRAVGVSGPLGELTQPLASILR